MYPILWWILWVLSHSLSVVNYKKSSDLWNLSKTMFKMYAIFFHVIVFLFLASIFWFEKHIIFDPIALLFLSSASILRIVDTLLWLYVYKTTKLSELLAYQNLDKLFIVIIWFFLYAWIEGKEVSILTLIITISTIIIVTIFSLDFKKLKIPKNIWIYILAKLSSSLVIIFLWYVLINYSAISAWTLRIALEFMFYILIAIFTRDSFKSLFTQSRQFYKYRFLSTFFGVASFIISLFIIKTSWVIIASLLGFLWVVFNIFFMKLLLKDNPSFKQILLAFIVIFMIWLWYYLK